MKLEDINNKNTALIIIDVQNDFCSRKGVFYKSGHNVLLIQKMIPKLIKFINRIREFNLPIIFIKSFYRRSRKYPQLHYCKRGSWGAKFYKIKPKGEKIIIKHTNDGFFNTKLNSFLKKNKIKNLLITGITTSVCVDTTARGGVVRGYSVAMVEDCIAAEDLELHRVTLRNFKTHFGNVFNSDVIIKKLSEIEK